ncbi:MAG: hypothetical protein JKP90_16635, partial [Desulfofustis sp. PB-SRB1]|nr:hypothetical protein [Desulfofustis sp. PB-SRB1]
PLVSGGCRGRGHGPGSPPGRKTYFLKGVALWYCCWPASVKEIARLGTAYPLE